MTETTEAVLTETAPKEKSLSYWLEALLFYGAEKELLQAEDMIYARNRLLAVMEEDHFIAPYTPGRELAFRKEVRGLELAEILEALLHFAAEKGLIVPNTTLQRDLFDTRLMDCLMPRPSEVAARFAYLYKTSQAEKATDYFYRLSTDGNYIRKDRIAKDLRWIYPSRYGDLDITINLSKPEKDPRDIAAAGQRQTQAYPLCPLCKEAVGYRGRVDYPARQNHRVIALELNEEAYYFQYSPYVYYNEHCIVFHGEHRPMKVNRAGMRALFDFIDLFPHYFIGSNADLPIVGGSILSHDHFQGGRCRFAMEKAKALRSYRFPEFPKVKTEYLRWPLSTLRLRSDKPDELLDLAERLLEVWRKYSDERFGILASTEAGQHNTVTPIARRRGNQYELDLVLRNNRCSQEHPLGIFHPHADKHHIKKENIGLIEVMGLAVLPSRMKTEMQRLIELYKEKLPPEEDEICAKHAAWFHSLLRGKEVRSEEELRALIMEGIGRVFTEVLEDCAVYPLHSEGLLGVESFLRTAGAELAPAQDMQQE